MQSGCSKIKHEPDLLSLQILYQHTEIPKTKLISVLKVRGLFKTVTQTQDKNDTADD